jgi:hypothetical protein
MIRNFLRFITPIIIGAILLYLWDMARVNLGATSFLALGQAYYTPIQITPLSDYPARISDLWQTIQYLFGHGIITGALLIFGIIQTIRRGKMIAWIFMLWIIGFVGLHIVLTLNLFDRNLLLIVPIACLWIGHSIASINWRLGIILAIMIVPFSLISTTGHYPIGGDDGRHTGIDDLADYLNSKPIAAVIYDRWLDWELDYYMGEWTNKRRVYFPTPSALVEGASELKEIGMRYFVAPVEEDISDWLLALTNAGFSVSTDYESENFRVFVIVPP